MIIAFLLFSSTHCQFPVSPGDSIAIVNDKINFVTKSNPQPSNLKSPPTLTPFNYYTIV